jgi:hypothetical protein
MAKRADGFALEGEVDRDPIAAKGIVDGRGRAGAIERAGRPRVARQRDDRLMIEVVAQRSLSIARSRPSSKASTSSSSL